MDLRYMLSENSLEPSTSNGPGDSVVEMNMAKSHGLH